MAAPTWVTGQVLAASDVNSWFVPLVAVKTADTSRASNTTITADPELSVTMAASATYRVELYIDFEGGTQGASDIKWNFTVPASATLRYHGIIMGTGGGMSVNNSYSGTTVVSAGTQGAGTLCGAHCIGSIVTSTSSGSIIFQWAQNTSSTTSTIVHAQSYLMLLRIS